MKFAGIDSESSILDPASSVGGRNSHRSGYIALISILIISTIGLIMALGFAQEGMETNKGLVIKNKGQQALRNASACAEEALFKLREDLGYQGDESLSLREGECQIYPVATSTDEILIRTKGVVDNYESKLKVVVGTTTPSMEIKSWQEVADF